MRLQWSLSNSSLQLPSVNLTQISGHFIHCLYTLQTSRINQQGSLLIKTIPTGLDYLIQASHGSGQRGHVTGRDSFSYNETKG